MKKATAVRCLGDKWNQKNGAQKNFQNPIVLNMGICYNTHSFLTKAVLETGGESSGGIKWCRR